MTFIDKLKSVRCQRHVIADNLPDIPQMNSGTAWTIADGGVPR